MSIHDVTIKEVGTGNFVVAQLDDALPASSFFEIEGAWEQPRSRLAEALQAARVAQDQWPQSLHWDWASKSELISFQRQTDKYRLFGLRLGAEWQGAMLTLRNEKTGRLERALGQPLIYVDFLESAPWNWRVPDIGQGGRYGRIGRVLLRFAVEQSNAEGCAGRLGLHALEQAEHLYVGIGMKSLGPDVDKEGLTYFEFSEDAAIEFMNRR